MKVLAERYVYKIKNTQDYVMSQNSTTPKLYMRPTKSVLHESYKCFLVIEEQIEYDDLDVELPF